MSIYTRINETPPIYIVFLAIRIFVTDFNWVLIEIYLFVYHERRFVLLVQDEVPVDALEEGVFLYVFAVVDTAHSLGGVAFKQVLQQVHGGGRQTAVLLQFVGFDLLEHAFTVLVELRR